MKRAHRYVPPEEVRKLITTIEDYCEKQVGDRRPLKKVSQATGIPKQTTSGWFCYQHFPRWETFEVFLQFFKDLGHRRHLESLWREAWPAEQRARNAGPVQGTTDPPTIAGAGEAARPTWAAIGRRGRRALAAVAAALALAVIAAVVNAALTWWSGRSDGEAGVGRRCARVTAATSPVYLNVDDPQPHKHKFRHDRVQLVDVPAVTVPEGAFLAVALPIAGDSRTGHGWMPKGDLAPTSCKGLGRTP